MRPPPPPHPHHAAFALTGLGTEREWIIGDLQQVFKNNISNFLDYIFDFIASTKDQIDPIEVDHKLVPFVIALAKETNKAFCTIGHAADKLALYSNFSICIPRTATNGDWVRMYVYAPHHPRSRLVWTYIYRNAFSRFICVPSSMCFCFYMCTPSLYTLSMISSPTGVVRRGPQCEHPHQNGAYLGP